MFQILIAIVLVAFAAASNNNYQICYPGNYCGPLNTLVAQKGTYGTPQACANQCGLVSSNHYFSYVPSSMQCLCAANCNSQVANPNVNSYCMNPPTYTECWSNSYCGPNNVVNTMAGQYSSPQACASKCTATNANFNFFNYVPSSEQCECTLACNSLIKSTGAFAYSLNGEACVHN